MPTTRVASPTNTSHSWCEMAPAAITGSPNAVIIGHHEPPGTWMWAPLPPPPPGGGGTRCAALQRGRRLATVGITSKLCGGGGDGIVHSSVAPPHGSSPAASPLVRERHKFHRNTSTERPIKNAP